MRCLPILILALLWSTFSFAQSDESHLTTADYDQANQFMWYNLRGKMDRTYVRPNPLENGMFWYTVSIGDSTAYTLVDPEKGTRKSAGSKKEILAGLDLPEGKKNTPRRSRTEITSPDGKKAVYIKDWNLYVKDLESGESQALTTDGIENFGYATDNAGWRKSDRPIVIWSPDSKKVATFQQDQRHVSDMYLVTTNVGAPTLKAWKYPLPEDEKIIQIHRLIIDVESGEMVRLKMDPDPRRGTLCDDISCSGKFDDNEWSPDSKQLAFVSSSRDHKVAKLQMADAQTGEVQELFTETVETQYESGQGAINWRYLAESNEIIWYSERDNWGHLYLYNATTGQLKHQITKGDFVVMKMHKVDTENRLIYFYAQGREAGRDPYFTHLYRVDFEGNNLELLTPEDANHRVSFLPGDQYFVDNFSQPHIPNRAVLRNMSGELILELEQADISRLEAMGWTAPEPITVKSRDERWDLYGLVFTPSHLDESKKYPVVNYIYPGPQGGGVGGRSFSATRGGHQALAELGFIVVVIDGTCNPGRSKAFHDVCYGNMADNTLEDQISGIRQLAKTRPYMDLDRVGMWGHSGGGFATAAALLQYPDFYKVGVSQSGNHDNRNYEDDWGERYIGLMIEGEDGKSNYEAQANQVYADQLKGKLLIAHGGMDDNVPPYNSLLLVDALIKANKDFDLIIYPNARHGYGTDNNYMTRRRWDYFVQHLMGKIPPKEYKMGR
ncbi:MAG: DPP IV N-terminal domain-containing protein [Bacteroidota bacterium]